MAASIVIVRRSRRRIETLSIASASALMGSLASLPFATPLAVTGQDLTVLAVFGSTNIALGLICFMLGAKRIPAAQTALIGALDAPLAP